MSGIKASRAPRAGQLVPLGEDGKFPASVGVGGPGGPQDPKGDPGPAGPEGPQGPKGDQGAPGQIGISGWQSVISPGRSLWPGSWLNGAATCPGGKKVLGGGASSTNDYSARITLRAPNNEGTAWLVAVRNKGSGSFTFYAWAICAYVS